MNEKSATVIIKNEKVGNLIFLLFSFAKFLTISFILLIVLDTVASDI